MNTTSISKTIGDRVAKQVAEQFGILATDVAPKKTLVADLRADSLDRVELVMSIEDEFGIKIPDEDAEHFSTVGDITAYIEKRQA